MTKHEKFFQSMLEEHKDFFVSFKTLHDQYLSEPEKFQEEFNREGERALEIIRSYEQSLLSKSTTSQFARFSNNLSNKFWESVRHYFPKIDFVGVSIS